MRGRREVRGTVRRAKSNQTRKVRAERDAHFSDQSRDDALGQRPGIKSDGAPV